MESRRTRRIESRRTCRIESLRAFAAESSIGAAAAEGGGGVMVSFCARRRPKNSRLVSRIMENLIVLAKLKKAYVPQMNFSLMKIERQFTCPSNRQRHIEDARFRLECHPYAGTQIHAVQIVIVY